MDRPVKQRLWGAAVLIALAVVFLPMLVKGPAPDSGVSDVPLDSPRAPDATVKTQELPLDVPGAVGQGGATGMPAPQAAAATTAPAQSDAAPATAAATSPATAAGDYAVNFGSYGSSSDADRVVQALNGIQLHGYSEKVSLGDRDAWRVRVGPYPTREAAEVARIQSGKLNAPVKAQVIALDASPAAATTPAQPAAAQPAATQLATAATAANKPAELPVATKPIERPKPAEPAKTEKPVVAAKPKPAPADAKPTVAQQDAAANAAKRDDAKPEPQPATKPAAAGTGFAVQLGAFANATQAAALRDRARAAGFSATTDTVHTDKGVLTRVRLGPVVGRDAAESLKSRAQSKLGITGIVRSSP